MDQKESLELFEQGENAWNTWANNMLTERKSLECAGTWMQGDKIQWNDETRSWHKKAKADFSGYKFTSEVDFRNFHFPGDASFNFAEFRGYATFENAEFHYEANFMLATFFLPTSFHSVEFEDTALFLQCSFKSGVFFGDSSFKKFANFKAVRGARQIFYLFSKYKELAGSTE